MVDIPCGSTTLRRGDAVVNVFVNEYKRKHRQTRRACMRARATTALRPLREQEPQRLGELAAGALRRAIIAGEFAAGTRLVEEELAAQLRVSRGPIRDALRQLAEEG